LSVLPGGKRANAQRLTRSQVAERLGISVSTVRRYEGTKLNPQRGAGGAHWFEAAEVTALAAELANLPRMRRRLRNAVPPPADPAAQRPARTPGEVAALVFEKFEQRFSLAEVVITVHVDRSGCTSCSPCGARG
jgi:hypothetical protein